MQFLDETAAAEVIERLIAEAKVARIAVAFWGQGATSILGLDRTEARVDVLCNLDSGACNPKEIESLLSLSDRISIRSNPRLHGKVYWTPDAVVIGSSNASTNGLAVEGEGLKGWAEANLLIRDTGIIAQTAKWLDRLKQYSHEITPKDLERARSVWKLRSCAQSPGRRLGTDIVDAYVATSAHSRWNQVKVAIYSEGLSRAGREQAKRDTRSNPELAHYDPYEDWRSELKPDDWILDFDFGHATGSFNGYWKVPNPKIETGLLTYVSKHPSILLPGLGKLTLRKRHQEQIRSRAAALVQKLAGPSAKNAIVPIGKIIPMLDG